MFFQLYMSGKPTFSLFPLIKNDFGSPEAEQVPSLLKNMIIIITLLLFYEQVPLLL